MVSDKRASRIFLAEHTEKLNLDEDLAFSVFHADQGVTGVLYQPHDPDRQEPHDQDEFYFVASGTATLEVELVDSVALRVGDGAFVPANARHRFTETSPDFKCWVVFFGERVPA